MQTKTVSVKINEKLKPFMLKPQPIKVAIGGRMSGKTIGISDMLVIKMATENADIYCLREHLDTIADSVHRSLKASITDRLGLQGWHVTEEKIRSPLGAQTAYKGASRNANSIQGADNYKYSWFTEAHTASQESLDKLIPTILRKPGAQCWFDANPQSSEDPFSKRFIIPYQRELLENGFYEDDLHYIVMINWRDNPWWTADMERLRLHAYNTLPRAKYDWIWEGAFNDSVQDGLILAEWFDACIDAHVKLNIPIRGAKMAAHDPSDEGGDSKGYAMRHGIVVLRVEEKTTGNVNEGGHWACALANQDQVDTYTWDCDGMGIALTEQTARDFSGTSRVISAFKGSESPDNPSAMYEPHEDGAIIIGRKKNEDAFKNKRAQYYFMLRDRIYRTYRAVHHGEYSDPDKLISFSSKIPLLSKLRAELCRMPVKTDNGSGYFELYTKQVMLSKFKISSPNLADPVMMLMRPVQAVITRPAVMPQPLPTYHGSMRRGKWN